LAIVKNKTTEANRKYWAHIEEVAKQVGKWPAWMIGRKIETAIERLDDSEIREQTKRRNP